MDFLQLFNPVRHILIGASWLYGQVASENKLVRRFVRVCKAHNIEATQIYRVFPGHGLLPSDFSYTTKSFPKLTADVIEEFCGLFDVDREWLETGSGVCHSPGHTYKHLEAIEDVQNELIKMDRESGVLKLIVIAPKGIDLDNFDTFGISVPIVIAYGVYKEIEGKDFVVYRSSEVLYWDYQKSRTHLRAVVEIADKNNFIVRGLFVPPSVIRSFDKGKACFAELVQKIKGVWDPVSELRSRADEGESFLLGDYYKKRTLP